MDSAGKKRGTGKVDGWKTFIVLRLDGMGRCCAKYFRDLKKAGFTIAMCRSNGTVTLWK